MGSLPKSVPAFKAWLGNQKIQQQELVDKTGLCMHTINKIVNTGLISKSNLKLFAFTFSFSDKAMAEMFKTQENREHFRKMGF